MLAASVLDKYYRLRGNYRKALAYFEEATTIRDNLDNKEAQRKIQEHYYQYQYEKKAIADSIAHTQAMEIKELALEASLERNRRQRLTILSILLGLMGIVVFLGILWRLLVAKRVANQKLQKVNAEVTQQKEEITAQRDEIEAQRTLLHSQNQMLEHANATKDKFFSIISHDLRTPVSGFKNLANVMMEKFDMLTPEQLKEGLCDLNSTANETIAMLNNLLCWARSQQDMIEVITFPANIKHLCSKVFDGVSMKLKEKNITIDSKRVEPIEAEVDEKILSTVLRNLLTNAIKFSPSNSTIEVAAYNNNGHLTISVKNHGIGMTQADVGKLFRIECDTKSIGSSPEKGSGVGLIICKELISLHKGNIQVKSKPNHGSTFTITIPNS